MRTIIISSIVVAGGAGVALGSANIGVSDVARLYAIQPIYDGAAPVTTIFTVTETQGGRVVATTPAGNTNKQFPILEQAFDVTGLAIAAGQSPRYVAPCVTGSLTVAVTAANAGSGYGIVIYLLED